MMSKKSPQLRFEGFTDDWEVRKLTDVTYSYSGLTYSPTDVQDKGTFVLRSSNVKNDQLIDADNVYVNPDIVNSNNVKVGDVIVVVRNGSRSLIGKHAIVTKEMPHTVIGAFMSAFRGENGDYINALLSTNNFQKEVHKSLGATINQITGKDFSMMNFLTPKLEEQNKIGSFFKQLDNTIALHQRKLDLLKEQKKGYLQKMFPKNGAKVPELRFAGFADDWEERKLQEVLRERNNQQPQSMEYPLVSFTVENGVTPKTDRYEREQLVVGDKSSKKYKVTVLNDIVYNPANLKFGAISRNKYGNAVFSPIYITFLVNNDVTTPEFIEMFVTRNDFIKRALKYQQGTVYERQSVSPTNLLAMNVYLPGKSEQEKIGSFFQQLDETIALHQRKLDLLKEQKKGFLQKMFV